MSTRTHYDTMGLARNCSLAVIKAAYKALALEHHPDKTLHLDAFERAEHAAAFRAVQEAYDVIGNETLRVQYDLELDQNGKVDLSRSTFHAPPSVRAGKRPTAFRRQSSGLTSPPEVKAAVKARIALQLRQIQEIRTQRELEEASMDACTLRQTLGLWKDVAKEHRDDPVLSAHCKAKVQEYEQKLRLREAEHAAWLNNLASPKGGVPTKPAAQRSSAWPNPASARASTKADERRRAEKKRAEEDAQRAQERMEEKLRRDEIKHAQHKAKAAAVQAEKEKQERLAEEAAAKKAAHIAKVRAKAAPATSSKTCGSTTTQAPSENPSYMKKTSSRPARQCTTCGIEHRSVAEWKRCMSTNTKDRQNAGVDEGEGFLTVV